MRFGLICTLSESEKRQLKNWIERALDQPKLSPPDMAYPLQQGRVGLYVDSTIVQVGHGYWEKSSTILLVGTDRVDRPGIPLTDRLGIIAALISAGQLWTDDMTARFSRATSRILLEAYNEMMSGLVAARGGIPATGLAFSADRQQVAARFGTGEETGWFLPGGAAATVGEDWTVVE